MELSNEFAVSTGVGEAWQLFNDVERIAPCLPGAELQEIEGDEYRGVVKVKIGPIVAQYKGKATFVEQDEANHRTVLKAEGRDVRGQGHAGATITATLTPEGDGTRVKVVTDLTLTGPAAQIGRGILADLSTRLLGQFVSCLESKVLAGVAAPAAAEAPASASGASDAGLAAAPVEPPATNGSEGMSRSATFPPEGASIPSVSRMPAAAARPVDSQAAEPDLLAAAGAPVIKRLVPAVAGLVLLWLAGRKLRGRG